MERLGRVQPILLWQRGTASLGGGGGTRNAVPTKEGRKEPNCVAGSPRQRSSQIKGPEAGVGWIVSETEDSLSGYSTVIIYRFAKYHKK